METFDPSPRTLSEAVRAGKLGEEAQAFLRGPATAPEPALAASPGAVASPPVESRNLPPIDRHPTTMTISPKDRAPVVVPAIVAMTFRLPASLAARLLEVSSARKLRRERPFHQQDIVAEALTLWLRQQGLD